MTQKEALDILKLGHNAYITGPAGSGKTHLLNMYIDYLKEHEVDIGVTASTGIAATHMGGVTIHAWSGLGVRDTLSEYDLEALQEKQYLWKRFEKVKVLIIDEVSMLHHFRLDLIERIVRNFKRNQKPFGGIQVILCGDFFQLPPVSRMGEQDAHFVYHAESWKEAGFKICYLEEQYRQTDDAALRVLNDIRGNRVDDSTMEHLRKCFKEVKEKPKGSQIEPTRLYTHNIDVDTVNERELDRLEGEAESYDMHERGGEFLVATLKKSCLAPGRLRLKKGARVMFVKNNFEAGYANGTLGVITSLHPSPVVRTASGKTINVPIDSWAIEEDGKIKAEITQYPLRLAWAITIHKSQGMSLDAVEVDLSKSFERGMGYVALSRVRTLAGLTILGLNKSALEVNPEILEYDDTLREESTAAVEELRDLALMGKVFEAQDSFIRSIAPSHVFDADGKGPKSKKGKGKKTKLKKPGELSTYETTRKFIEQEYSIKEIALRRGMTEETIISHIEKMIAADPIAQVEIEYLRSTVTARKFEQIATELRETKKKHGDWRLSPVKNALGANVSYREIQLVRLFVKAEEE